MKSTPLHIKLDQKQEKLKSELDMQDDVKTTDLQDSGMLEELIEDTSFSPFPQIQNTERPDKVLAALQEGRDRQKKFWD